MEITAPSGTYINSFNENFDTYVAFMRAFRQAWNDNLEGWPAAVGEGNPQFTNVDNTGSAVPAGIVADGAKYAFFYNAVSQLMQTARDNNWIQPI